MNLQNDLKACLDARGWTPHRLAREAGLKSDMGIRRVLSGERQGMHSKNLQKLLPFLYPTPGQGLPCDPASSSREPGQGEGEPSEHVHVAHPAIHCMRCGAWAVISDPVGGPVVEKEFRERHRACGEATTTGQQAKE